MKDYLLLESKQIANWFNAIRNLPDVERTRALDAFWSGQIDSKCWLVNILNDYVEKESNIYIFGGWLGVLSSMLFQSANFKISHITSIDVDPWCEHISREICNFNEKFLSVTEDMKHYNYNYDLYPDIIINTSTEHVTQETYDIWYDKIPNKSLIVLQGNNYFDCSEHLRCSNNLLEFKRMNHVSKPIFEGLLPSNIYDRYMCIFQK